MSGLAFTRRATPAAPTAGKDKLFFDETGELRQIGSDGIVRKVRASRLEDITDAGSLAAQNADDVALTGGSAADLTITGGSAALSGALTTTAGGIGYATGAGGTVSQTSNKSTSVTLDKLTGKITTSSAALAGDTTVSFTLNNSTVTAEDHIVADHFSGGTLGSYVITGRATGAGTASITIRNVTGGSLSEALVIKFTVIKGTAS